MAFFFYNTDDGEYQKLIKRGFAVTGGPRKFGRQLGQLRALDTLLMYENGTGIVAMGRVREEWDRKAHTNVWYYPDDPHEYRIRVKWFRDLSKNPISIAQLKRVLGYQPRWAVRRITKRAAEVQRLVREFLPSNTPSEETAFLEGEKRAMKGTVRNPQLREAAKKKYGLKCYCCGFDYEAFYGDVAKGLAIVHHLQLFSNTNGKRRKTTVKDVRVVCANCHHVIHVEKPPFHIDDLKKQTSERWTVWSEKGISRKK
jgi:hypothetical protein